ncbi:MAG: NAD(P)-dependent oxidoreductase [bacterium]|nr:NAD(P)-dependent oxidoreductase [bacterium]
MLIGVTGASGFIGRNLVPELLKNGHTIKLLMRSKNQKILWPEAELYYGDFKNPESLIDFVKDLDTIIHCAGVIKALKKEDFISGNYTTTKNLIDAINTAKPESLKRFIFLSSQSAQGPSKELTPKKVEHTPEPVSWYGKSKLMAENYIINYLQYPYTILRLSSVYGPYDKETLRFFQYVKWGIFPMPNGEKYLSIIYVKDVVKLIKMLIGSENTGINRVYFVSNPEYTTLTQIVEHIKSLYGKKRVHKITIPEWIFRPILKLSETFARITNTPTIANSDKANELAQKYWIGDPTPLYMETGFKPDYTLIEGLYETLLWYKENGWI